MTPSTARRRPCQPPALGGADVPRPGGPHARPRGLPPAGRRRVGVDDLGRDRRAGPGPRRRAARPRRPAGGARRADLLHARRLDARRLRDPLRRGGDHDGLPDHATPRTSRTSSPTPGPWSPSPRTTTRSPSCATHRAELPGLRTVVTFDGTAGRRLGDRPGRPGRPRPQAAGRRRRPGHDDGRRDQARPPGDPDLHRGTTGQAQGRPAQPRLLGLRGRRGRRRGPAHRGRRAVPVAAAVALVRQGAAGRAGRDRVRPPRSTAGSTRSSTTSRWSSRRSWPPRRASSRRSTAGS